MIVPAFGSNKFIVEKKYIAAEQKPKQFLDKRSSYLLFLFLLFISKMKMRNENAAKRIGKWQQKRWGKGIVGAVWKKSEAMQEGRADELRGEQDGRVMRHQLNKNVALIAETRKKNRKKKQHN